MNFLIIEYNKENEKEPFLTRSLSVIDGEMSIKMLFLTFNEDVIKNLTGESHSTGEFITKVDEKCIIVNNGKIISIKILYNELDYIERDTDIDTVKLATIQISLKGVKST